MPVTMTPEQDREIREIVLDDLGVLITDEGVEALLKNESVLEEVAIDGLGDTAGRETVWDAIAVLAGKPGWPCYGDGLSEQERQEWASDVVESLVGEGLARPLTLDEALANAGVPGR